MSSSTRGSYAKSEATRAAILQSARRAFAADGFQGASVRRIAEEAGLTYAGLRHHYATKDELLIAVLRARDEEHSEMQADVHGEDLLRYLQALFDRVLDEPGITEVFTTQAAEAANRDHPAHTFFVQRYQRVRAEFSSELTSAVAAGRRLSVSPDQAAALLAAAMDGLQLQWLLDPSLDVRAVFRGLIEMLMPSAQETPAQA